MLNLEELQQLVSFAETGTLSKVAEQMHISTPSLTRSMQNIEECFGVPLFNRSKNRIELNENGRLAVEYAGKLLQETEQMLYQVRAYDERRRTIVVKSCAPAPMWELLKQLGNRHPGMTISSAICLNEEVMQFMNQSACDIAILPFDNVIPGWEVQRFMQEKLYVCIPKEHEFAGYSELYFKDINGFNFLLRSELGFWDAMCREKMPASKFLVQTDDAVFNELVNASSLPCFTTDYIAGRESAYPGRVCVPVADEEAEVTFFIYKKC